MSDILRQRRPETFVLQSAVATFAMMQIGTSVALALSSQPQMVQSGYGFESVVSPDAQRLERKVLSSLEHLRLHSAMVDVPETLDAPVNRTHIPRAAAASELPDMTMSGDDFTAVMAARTRFPRSFDVDDEE